jgi:hypothetical protein
MITTISDNNASKIGQELGSFRPKEAVIVDYGYNVLKFLDFLSQSDERPDKITFFCEVPPTYTSTVKRFPWSLNDLKEFFLARPPVGFENHKPVYDEDQPRLSRWRAQYAAGPFQHIWNALYRRFRTHKISMLFLSAPVLVSGVLLQLLVPNLRPQKGIMTFDYKGIAVTLHFDGNPERDHYGESPLIKEKIEKFADAVSNAGTLAIFIASGPRHLYLRKTFELEDAGALKDFMVYCSGLYRPAAYKITEERSAGLFYKGSNVSIENKVIYSDHCLSIGAGDRELWCYRKAA